jgi:dTDP-4-amino-4,6-dideoxygalactose transaminase
MGSRRTWTRSGGSPQRRESHAGCFSFYPGKNLGAFGDAGAVVTNDGGLADRVRSLSDHGRCKGGHYRHERPGGTHRLDALQAAILSVKLGRLDAWNAGRRRAAEWYARRLAELPVETVRTVPGACSSYRLEVILTPRREHLRRKLAAQDIATGVHYPIPCHRQPMFEAACVPELPVAEGAADGVLSLPMHPHLTEIDVERIAATIADALAEPRSGPCTNTNAWRRGIWDTPSAPTPNAFHGMSWPASR